jgi:transcription antitermination factor NusG
MGDFMNSDRSAWYAVRTQPRKESFALTNIERQGFQGFCPRMNRVTRHARKTVTKKVPLFTSYIFVQIDTAQGGWRAINNSFGVMYIVGTDHCPTPCPPGLVDHMRAHTTEAGVVEFNDTLAPGDGVQIVGGPFDRMIGRVLRMRESERVTVLMQLLCGEVPVTLDRGAVIRTPASQPALSTGQV